MNGYIEFDQSTLFHFIYSEAFGTAGGEPFGVILADYYIQHRPRPGLSISDVNVMKGLAQIGAAAFTPIVLAPSPQLFGINDFSELGAHIHLNTLFKSPEYQAWRAFREEDDARFIVLVLPQILMRSPYQLNGHDSSRLNIAHTNHHGLNITEKVAHPSAKHYLWGNACYALGTILIREYSRVGWFSHIRGVLCDDPNGGLVSPPATLFSPMDSTKIHPKPQTNILVTEQQERKLNQQGFMALCQNFNSPGCAFFTASTLHQAKQYTDELVTTNARLSAMLQHILCGARFAHYIKVMIREKIGSFFSALECQSHLQRWLHQYTSANEDLDWQAQARYPLREADVKVREIPGKTGYYLSEIKLKPQYQVDQIVSELKLITELSNITSGT